MRWSYLSTVSTWFGQSCCFDTCCSLHPSTAPAKSWTSEPKWTCPSWTHLAYLIKIWPGHHAKQCHSAGSVWPRAWCLHAQAVPQHLPESSRAVFNFIPGIWSVLIPLIPFLVANIVCMYVCIYIYIHIQYICINIHIYTGLYRVIQEYIRSIWRLFDIHKRSADQAFATADGSQLDLKWKLWTCCISVVSCLWML